MADVSTQDLASATGPLTGFDILSVTCAAVLAGVFLWAAVAKLRARPATTHDFAALGLPRASTLAVAVPLLELAVAGLLVVVPGWGGVAAFVTLVLFSSYLLTLIRSGSTASCACFGGSSRAPVSTRQLARNGLLAALALAAVPYSGSVLRLL